jgi:SAM-dependent methyltransferase
LLGVGHQADHELSERRVEGAVLVGQRLGRGHPGLDSGKPLAADRDRLARRVEGADERTAHAAREAGLENVETLEGELEAIPLPDASVDLIISNGVINLSARKARVMAECARSLRPGGRLCVSDLTVEQDDLPPEILTQPAAWAGCVAGALAEDDFVRKLERPDSATSRSRTERR